MILIIEQDINKSDNSKFLLKPFFFKGNWRYKTVYRCGWGYWSLSYYPEIRLKTFFEYIMKGNVEWRTN